MTQRDRQILAYLGGGLGGALVLALVAYQWFLAPMEKYRGQIANLTKEIAQHEQQVQKLNRAKADLKKYYSFLSLPPSPDKAAAEYAKYLKPLLRDSGLTVDDFQGPPPAETKPAPPSAKKALHTTLTFQVRAKGTMGQLIAALEKMQATPLAHRVKNLTLDRLDSKDATAKLGMQMTIEALIIHKAERRDFFLAPDPRLALLDAWAGLGGGPIGLALLPWAAGPLGPQGGEQLAFMDPSRNYDGIPEKNIFLGFIPAPVEVVRKDPPARVEEKDDPFDMREYYRLASIDSLNQEAFLRNFAVKMPEMRLRPKAGFNTFKIRNEERTRVLVDAKILRIDQRDVYFLVKDDIFGIHIGQNLAEAMRRPLSDAQLQERGLMDFLPQEEKEQQPEKKGKSPKL